MTPIQLPVRGSGGPAQGPSGSGRRERWLLLPVVLGTGAALVAAVALVAVIVAVLVARAYQPLGPGTADVTGLPGLPGPVHARQVNMFGAQAGELYIPPQRGTFGVSVSLGNSGSHAVTIEAVTMTPPGTGAPWPLVPAGPVLYWTGYAWGNRLAGRPVAGLSLKPGQSSDIFIGIPVHTSSCYGSGSV